MNESNGSQSVLWILVAIGKPWLLLVMLHNDYLCAYFSGTQQRARHALQSQDCLPLQPQWS